MAVDRDLIGFCVTGASCGLPSLFDFTFEIPPAVFVHQRSTFHLERARSVTWSSNLAGQPQSNSRQMMTRT